MPQTVPDGFEFEVLGEQPGRTLHGGDPPGSSPILAEQIQTKFATVDAGIADLVARVTALEDGSSGLGWIPITHGQTVGNVVIDLTGGGRFPAGEFHEIEVVLRGTCSESTLIGVQANDDSTSGLHRTGYLFQAAADGAVTFSDSNFVGNRWWVANWANISHNLCRIQLHDTDESSAVPFMAASFRQASAVQHAGGRLEAVRLLDSMQVFTDTGSFTDIEWWARGFRVP